MKTRVIEINSIYEAKLAGNYPNVPFAEGVDIEALTASDREAGRKPFFVTLPLGERDQVSHNRRRYKGDVAVEAIAEAIRERRVTGRKGHSFWVEETPEVFRWVGATVVDNVVWGKAYIIPTKEGLDLREVYRTAMASNATVATSLQGRGSSMYNEEDDIEEVVELTVHFIDAVADPGVDVAKAIPHLTHESVVTEDELAEALNQAIELLTDGALSRVVIIGQLADATGLKRVAVNDILRGRMALAREHVEAFADILNIDLEELLALAGHEVESTEEQMAHKPKSPLPDGDGAGQEDVDIRLIEMKEAHADAIREKDLLIAQLQAGNRALKRLREQLGISEDDDVVLAVQALESRATGLENQVADLMEATVNELVRKMVKVEKLQPMVAERVLSARPLNKAEAQAELNRVLEQPHIAEMLRWGVEMESGPAQERESHRMGANPDNGQADPPKATIIIPTMGEQGGAS